RKTAPGRTSVPSVGSRTGSVATDANTSRSTDEWKGSRCMVITTGTRRSRGSLPTRFMSALTPPAEAPMPKMRSVSGIVRHTRDRHGTVAFHHAAQRMGVLQRALRPIPLRDGQPCIRLVVGEHLAEERHLLELLDRRPQRVFELVLLLGHERLEGIDMPDH